MLTQLFKTEERIKILQYVMDGNTFSVAEVSKAAGVNKGLVSRHLRYLEAQGLVSREGRRYSTLKGGYVRATKLLLNLDKIDLSSLSMGFASSLGLYGSWARGTNDKESDLDVWIRSDSLPSESELARLQRDLRSQSGTEVNLLVLTPEKLDRLKKEDAPFYSSLVMTSLTLKGEPLEDSR
jgi:predicted nucleotidyltransferase